MDYSSGMLIGKWSREKNILELMRGESEERVLRSVTIRALPGTVLLVDGREERVPETGVLKGILPGRSLCISSTEKVHARIEYQFDETLL